MLGTEYPTSLPLQIFVSSFCARGQQSWAQGHRALMALELGFAYVLSTIPLFPKLLGKQRRGWKERNNGRIGRYLVLYLCPFCFQMIIVDSTFILFLNICLFLAALCPHCYQRTFSSCCEPGLPLLWNMGPRAWAW